MGTEYIDDADNRILLQRRERERERDYSLKSKNIKIRYKGNKLMRSSESANKKDRASEYALVKQKKR